MYFNVSDKNIELPLRTVISANQLTVYGAVADLCDELSESFGDLVKPEALDYLDKTVIRAATVKPHARIRARWLNITLFLRKKNLDFISLDQKSRQENFSVMRFMQV